MAKNPDNPKKPGKTPKSKAPSSKASRPDVQPIGPALAELLNLAINRGDAGMGSGTGLQPPPDNSWDRRSGGEAAAHRARASTKANDALPPPNPPPQAGEGTQVARSRAYFLRQRLEYFLPQHHAVASLSPLPLAGEGWVGVARHSL